MVNLDDGSWVRIKNVRTLSARSSRLDAGHARRAGGRPLAATGLLLAALLFGPSEAKAYRLLGQGYISCSTWSALAAQP
jgi:hypothetical protein